MTTASRQLEDPLEYLPCSTIVTYRRGESIYGPSQPSASLFLVIDGKVKISRMNANGHQVMIDILQTDEFFGESAFLGAPNEFEQASALQELRLMAWDATAVQEIMLKRPGLGLALVQLLVGRADEWKRRIESMAVHTIVKRLELSLQRFGTRFGAPDENGWTTMMAMSHELLAQYLGTSREIVTQHMAQLRREGQLTYTRSSLSIAPTLGVAVPRRPVQRVNGVESEAEAMAS